jgi:N-ethylmaleimide reductase
MMVDFYQQRASKGGLLITEATHPSVNARGYLGTPCLYTDHHVKAWARVVDAVHDRGGVIVPQVGHDGRQSPVDLRDDGKLPLAPSVVPFNTEVVTQDGWVPQSPHRALEISEIKELIQPFHDCAQLAVDAGFDGIELHSANGYLVDTFLQDGTNKRTDAYGGSIANRARLPLELTETLVDVFGPGRVGVRVSPNGTWGSISDSDPQATFGYFAEQLNGFPLAYLHVIEPRVRGVETVSETADPVASAFLRRHFNGPIIAAGGFDGPGASKIIDEGSADVVAFGRLFASNPDLPERIRNEWPLAPYDRSAFWGGTEFHYSDYPPYAPAATPHSATFAA